MPLKNQRKLISIVIPAFNEETIIEVFHKNLLNAIEKTLGIYEWEFIFVDDGSTDNTRYVLRNLRNKDKRIKWISFSRNFGHQSALTAGLKYASGDAVITIDCDLQHPASLIPEMINRWENGFDLVITMREDDQSSSFLKRFTSNLFYRIINTMSNTQIEQASADFRLMSRKAVNAFLQFGEFHRFIRGMVAWMGFSTCTLLYKSEIRKAGKSKYTFKKMINLALDGLTSFSIVPLRISTILGILIFFGALAYAIYAIVIWFTKPETLQIGWTSLMVTINLLCGAILLFIGLIGEYVGRIYEQVKMRPIYLIDEAEGFDEENRA